MKRILMGILIGVFLTMFLFLLKPGLAGLARERHEAGVSEEKPLAHWETVKGKFGEFKVLRLWNTNIGPKTPRIALLQLFSKEQRRELESNPLDFYGNYKIFTPCPPLPYGCVPEHDQGHFVLRLEETKVGSNDPEVAIAVHAPRTYSGFASFEVDKIEP